MLSSLVSISMTEDIAYTRRYIYHLDAKIVESLETLYFDSLTFEQKSYKEFVTRRTEEILQHDIEVKDPNVYAPPVIVKPKERNIESITHTLTNLQISKSSEQQDGSGGNEDDGKPDSDLESESESESESGSESESERDKLAVVKEEEETGDDYESTISFMATKSPFILFKSNLLSNQVFGLYKTTINAIDSPNFNPLENLKTMSSRPMSKDPIKAGMSAIFMISSGHFAGAIISHLPHSTKGNKGSLHELQLQSVRLLAHKTFHRYTTRRKQGGSQSAMDDSKGKANSAGSTLRRYNEQALGKDIEMIMQEWKPLIESCENIFIRGSGKGGKHARGIGLIVRDAKDPKMIIAHGDKRVKMIPFATRRPTTMEIKRAWCELMYLKAVEMPKVNRVEIDKRRKRDELLNKSKIVNTKDDNDELVKLTNECIALLKKGKVPAFILFMKKNRSKLDINYKLEPQEAYKTTPTLLHYASRKGYAFMVQTLMVQLHADASVVNLLGKTAYEIANDKDTRYAFRIARGLIGENDIDWGMTKIGDGMTKQEAEDLKNKDKLKQQELEDEERKELKQVHESIVGQFRNKELEKGQSSSNITGPGMLRVTEEQKLSGLSEMQRMKVLREQRFRAIEARLKRGDN